MLINNNFVSNANESIRIEESRDSSLNNNLWFACSLAWDQYRKIKGDKILGKYYFIGTIDEPIIKQHVLIILAPSFTTGETFAVSNDSEVIVFPYDYEDGFNKMMKREHITVSNFDDAYRIARLFVRIMLPMISCGRSFFLDELCYTNVTDFINTQPRNEIDTKHADFDSVYNAFKKNFQKSLQKEIWHIMITKNDRFYRVCLLTATALLLPTFPPTNQNKVLKWEIIVYPDGSIKATLPKGIRLYNPFVVKKN